MDVKEETKEDPENSKKSEPDAPEDVAMKPSTILRTSGPSPTPAGHQQHQWQSLKLTSNKSLPNLDLMAAH